LAPIEINHGAAEQSRQMKMAVIEPIDAGIVRIVAGVVVDIDARKRAMRCDDFDHLAHKVRGALIFLKAQLPPWVFSGVMQRLKVQQMRPPYHEIRWLMVREARIEKKLLAQEACEYVSKKLANTPARGARKDRCHNEGPIQKVESELPPGLRLSPPRVLCHE
jgi:hypothetical protein